MQLWVLQLHLWKEKYGTQKINITLKQFNNDIENIAIKSAKNKFYRQKITITMIYPVERLRKLPLLTNLDVW